MKFVFVLALAALVVTLASCSPLQPKNKAAAKPAGTKAAGTQAAGTKATGTKAAGAKEGKAKEGKAKPAGIKAAGTKEAGTKAAETKAAPAKAGKDKAGKAKGVAAKGVAAKPGGANLAVVGKGHGSNSDQMVPMPSVLKNGGLIEAAPASFQMDGAPAMPMGLQSGLKPDGIPMEMPKGMPVGIPMEMPKGMPVGIPMEMPKGMPVGNQFEMPMPMSNSALMGFPQIDPPDMPMGMPILTQLQPASGGQGDRMGLSGMSPGIISGQVGPEGPGGINLMEAA